MRATDLYLYWPVLALACACTGLRLVARQHFLLNVLGQNP